MQPFPTQSSSLLLILLLNLTTLFASVSAFPGRNLLFTTRSTISASSATCETYAIIANLSTIGLNSTFRAAFLQAAPFGTKESANILNNAESEITVLFNNTDLNDRCGNSTAIAITGAATNFSEGIVGEFKINGGSSSAAVRTSGRLLEGWGLMMLVAGMGAVALV